MEHENDFYTNIIGALGTITKGLIKGQKNREIRGRGGHPNYCINLIDQNTEKYPGDLKKLCVTQTQVKDHQLTLMWKIPKE